jgi:WD40 repeat protein
MRLLGSFGSTALERRMNYYKTCSWSPDGSSFITSNHQNHLSVFYYTPEWMMQDDCSSKIFMPTVDIPFAENIYDFEFYPLMNSMDPATCCFLVSCRDHPLRLFDATSGLVRASYITIDHVDQITAPHAVAFNLDGSKILCGFENSIQIFDTCFPGKECLRVPLTTCRKSSDGIKGIVSSIAFNPDYSGLYALGLFSGTIGLFDERNNDLLDTRQESKGVTQVEFTKDGTRLVAASRKSHNIRIYDLRNTGECLFTLKREADTNQRIKFSFDPTGRFLLTGDLSGNVSIYDLESQEEDKLVKQILCHKDVCSSAVHHPYLPLVVTTSGHRRPEDALGFEDTHVSRDARVCLWKDLL